MTHTVIKRLHRISEHDGCGQPQTLVQTTQDAEKEHTWPIA